MKTLIAAAIFLISGPSFAIEYRGIIPGSTVKFNKTIQFKNISAEISLERHDGKEVKLDGKDFYCSLWALIPPATNKKVMAGREFTTIHEPDRLSHSVSGIFLTPTLGIECYYYSESLDYLERGWIKGVTYKEVIEASLPYLKVTPKQNPDEEF